LAYTRHISLFSPNRAATPKGWKVSEINTYGTMDPYLLYWMSEMEQKGITWDKNMEDEFWEFMLQFKKKMEEKQVFPQVMTIIATPQ
jgi:hypothetical protein